MSGYRPGDHYVICDECGGKFHVSETLKRWDKMRVCRADWEPRHPQDFVRGRRDRQRVVDPRPEPRDTFINGVTLTDDDGLTPLQDDSYVELIDA